MKNENQEVVVGKVSESYFPEKPYPIRNNPYAETWMLIVFLVVCFVILKSFIYLKDEKRHGK